MDTKDLSMITIDGVDYDLVEREKPLPQNKDIKIGDWVVYKDKPHLVYAKNRDIFYLRQNEDGCLRNTLPTDILRPWTLKDAKDGDILMSTTSIFVYAGIDTKKEFSTSGNAIKFHMVLNCGTELEIKEDIGVGSRNDSNGIRPATKEERELLFLQLAVHGYEWDVNKKELKKIVKRVCENCPFNNIK